MDNLLSYCGLVDARISTSEKDLPVIQLTPSENLPEQICDKFILNMSNTYFEASEHLARTHIFQFEN